MTLARIFANALRAPAWAWCHLLLALMLPACVLYWLADRLDPTPIKPGGPPVDERL